MNLTHLDTFLKVAKLRSFSAAAAQLNVSKGLVSRHIKALETDLNSTLLHRTTRSVTVTEAGNTLLNTALQIEGLTFKARRNIESLQKEDCGHIKFTAPSSLYQKFCTSLIPEFNASYPNVDIHLEFSTALMDIEFGEFDVALRANDQLPSNVIAKPVGAMINILVASPEWAEKKPINSPYELTEVESLQNSLNSEWNQWALICEDNNHAIIDTKGTISSSNYGALKALAIAIMGVANLPIPIVEDSLKRGELVRVLPQWHTTPHYFYLVYARQKQYPKKLTDFINSIFVWRTKNAHWFTSQ